MQSIAKLGKPYLFLISLVFAIGGVTAAAGGKPLEGVLYFALAGGFCAFCLWGKSETKARPGASATGSLRRRESLRRHLHLRTTVR